MSDNSSTATANRERQEFEQTLGCVEEMIREFENMAARSRMDSAEMSVMAAQFQGRGSGHSTNSGGAGSASDFPELEQSTARQKALGKELVEAAAAFTQELINWVGEIERREAREKRLATDMDPIRGAIQEYPDVAEAAYVAGYDALPGAQNAAAGHPEATTDAQQTQSGLTLQAFAETLASHGVDPYDEAGDIIDEVYHAAIRHYQDVQGQRETDFLINHTNAAATIEATKQTLSNPWVQAALMVAPIVSEVGSGLADSVSTSMTASIDSSMPGKIRLGPSDGKWIKDPVNDPASTPESILELEPVETDAGTINDDSLAIVPKGAGPLGQWGETRLADILDNAGNKPDKALMTELGPRYLDRIVGKISHESKAGIDVQLTSRIQLQIDKDVELTNTGVIDGSHWHFFQGADDELLQELTNHGIVYTVHQ